MITWNVFGPTVPGFEQSLASPVVAVSMLLDWVEARDRGREALFTGRPLVCRCTSSTPSILWQP